MPDRMRWLKLWHGWYEGSTALWPEAQRYVFVGLLTMAGESRVRGCVCRAKGIPYTINELAVKLSTTPELVQATIDSMSGDMNDPDLHDGDTRPRIHFDDKGCLWFTNFDHFQQSTKRERQPMSEAAKWNNFTRTGMSDPHKAKRIVDNLYVDPETGEICS